MTLKEKVHQRLAPIVKKKGPFPQSKYEWAALIAEWREDSFLTIGHLYLKAAWDCNVSDKPKGEKVYRIKAIEYFQKAFQENKIPEDAMPEYLYLIGELYRRVGDREASINWLDRVSEAIGKDGAKKWLIDLAEQQKTHPKDFFDET